jgi:nitrite reductase/ring-hydroxylating ferredoxin subunit
MPELFEISDVESLPVGRAKACVVNGRTIALYHTRDGFFVTDNTCPHRGGPLAEGDLIGNEITCPWHLWSFDVATGVCMGNPEISVEALEVHVEGGRVFVRLP